MTSNDIMLIFSWSQNVTRYVYVLEICILEGSMGSIQSIVEDAEEFIGTIAIALSFYVNKLTLNKKESYIICNDKRVYNVHTVQYRIAEQYSCILLDLGAC